MAKAPVEANQSTTTVPTGMPGRSGTAIPASQHSAAAGAASPSRTLSDSSSALRELIGSFARRY
jgi:hypothetical protein